MPRDGSGVYSSPPGTHGTPNTTILSANYNSNVDDVAADLNTPRPIVAGGTGATTAAGALTAIGAVAKTGDTMTGPLTVTSGITLTATGGSWPTLELNKSASGQLNQILGYTNNNERWLLSPGDSSAETGANVGSDFVISRYSDAGAFLSTPFTIKRPDGRVILQNGLSVGGTVSMYNGSIKLSYDPVAATTGIITRAASDGGNALAFQNAADVTVGSIVVTSGATAYNTASDDRLKEDLQSFDAGNIVDDTEVYDFKWKSTGERAYGVIAQQAIEVYPTAVTHTEKNDWWGVDYSKYVPVLLQELKALRARVAALEGGGLSGKPA